ncbi:MAG: hypothetical protein DLM50_02775 [Candidatus Meridianibacter frigidus]|nr:MAG: hypothetical protein DLM50_02775 [Candidatus Eremiobacteraeota bacterium]
MKTPQAIALYGSENPFSGASALCSSNYTAPIAEDLARLLDWKPVTPKARLAHSAVRTFLLSPNYPCVGARAAITRNEYRFGFYAQLAAEESTAGLARDLAAFAAERPAIDTNNATFLAVFEEPRQISEAQFEESLWRQLGKLRTLDARINAYDPTVSNDPTSPHFAFSFAREAFFVVGMHSESSRLARRSPWPVLAFNAHVQFRTLRATGKYGRFQRLIRARDHALQGSLNPNLCEFGERSEAAQYSGRPVEDNWKCPYSP